MDFKPNIKSKKCRIPKEILPPFPLPENGKKFTGIFDGFCIEINQDREICEIYENGCFGKGSKSRSAPEIVRGILNRENDDEYSEKETLIVDLEESYFLVYNLKILELYDLYGKKLELSEIFTHFLNIKNMFLETMIGYLYLKSKNWIVKSGIKFGGHFVIYKKSMRYYHASFIVFINNKQYEPKDIQGLQRIAETSDKDILFLDICQPKNLNISDQFELFEHFKEFEISEMIIKRFNFCQSVQSQ